MADEVNSVAFTRALEVGLQYLLREATSFPQSDIPIRQIAILLICARTADPVPVAEIANELGTDVRGIAAPIRMLVRQRQIQLRKQPGRGLNFDAMLTRHGYSYTKELWKAAQANTTGTRAGSAPNATKQSSRTSRQTAGLARPMPSSPIPTMNARIMDIHVGQRIRLRRKMIGFSQRRLAVEIGIPLQRIQRLEYGVDDVDSAILVKLADKLDVPVSFFFDGLSKEVEQLSIPTNGSLVIQDVDQMSATPDELPL